MNSYNNLPSFKIDYKDFLRGQNSYQDYPDGGIVTDAVGANPYLRRAWLTTAPEMPEIELVGNVGEDREILAYVQQPLTNDLVAVGQTDNNDGQFYLIDNQTGVYTQVGPNDATQNYLIGGTDAVYYKNKFYFTSVTDIIQAPLTLVSPDLNYWTNTLGMPNFTSVKHPMLVFEDILYIGDGKYLHQIDNGTGQDQVLDLDDGYIIDCLIEYNNLIFIAASQKGNKFSKIYTWDGFSPSWLDSWTVNDTITSLFIFQGILFVFFNNMLGYFDGTKVKQIREIIGSVTKHMVTKSRTSMYFIETDTRNHSSWVTRYGPIIIGANQKNVFLRYFKEFETNFRYKTCIIGANQAFYTSAVNNPTDTCKSTFIDGDEIDASSATQSYTFEFNERVFTSNVLLRIAVAKFEGVSASQTITIKYRDDTGTINDIGICDATDPSESRKETFESMDFAETRIVAPIVEIQKAAQLKEIEFFYEPVELR